MKIFKYLALLLLPTLGVAQTTTNPPAMVLVQGGQFKMGSQEGYPDEMPQHNVTLNSFYIGKYEVTVAQYRAFCIATGRKMPSDPTAAWYEEHDNAIAWKWLDNNPIVNVSWYDAVAYCKWLTQNFDGEYTLPTEAQWEFAARGGVKSQGFKYAGSNNIDEVAWYDETTYEKGIKPVGRLKPNELGIYDMSGNAWEWCLDIYGPYAKGSQKEPKGASQGEFKVIRGGSWYYVEDMARLTSRDGPRPTFTNYNYGFRVVKKASK